MFESAPELVPVLSKENTIRIAKEVEKLPADHIDRADTSLYTLQFMLVDEIEGLMVKRTSKGGEMSDMNELRHLSENIGYNVRITKI